MSELDKMTLIGLVGYSFGLFTGVDIMTRDDCQECGSEVNSVHFPYEVVVGLDCPVCAHNAGYIDDEKPRRVSFDEVHPVPDPGSPVTDY